MERVIGADTAPFRPMPAGLLTELATAAEPWVAYRALLDLCSQPENADAVRKARAALLAHPLVRDAVASLQDWPGVVLNSHKSASQPFHRLAFLADLGLKRSDPGLAAVAGQMAVGRSPEGLFRLPMTSAKSAGPASGAADDPASDAAAGDDEVQRRAWALCDAPLLLYAAARMELVPAEELEAPLAYLLGLALETGWPCVVSPELAPFHGPGRRDEPCPYATLAMLRLLSSFPKRKTGAEASAGVACLLGLWEHSRERHPFMFYMGTDFRKLKAPFIWYDIIHVADVLSQFPQAIGDPRLNDMIQVILAKADSEGRFTPESAWKAWGAWDFGQKKRPSPWLTLLVWRMVQRAQCEQGRTD